MSTFIARFNPYNMDAETVLAVATGREAAIAETLQTLKENLDRKSTHQHLMVYGPRGRGKSFFLKYLGIKFGQEEIFSHCRFIVLPEEQNNIRFASDIVRMVLSQIEGTGFSSVIPHWKEPDTLWQQEYSRLEKWCREQKKAHADFMLVLVIENFNDLLGVLDDQPEGKHRLRHMLEHLPAFTLIGASPSIHVDDDYNNPIFKIFKEIKLPVWGEKEYLAYFRRRRELETEKNERNWTPEEARLMEIKLRAISHYTGGSPRMAVVLTDLLLKEDLVSTARTLYGLVDELTPYYQDLVKELRKRSNSLALFDALIRFGENLSQSELAERLGAKQSDISKAFSWLHENGYVSGKKRTGSKEFRYYVSDRVFVLFYLDREVLFNESKTMIWIMADFLKDFYTEDELRYQAFYNVVNKPSPESDDIMRVWMKHSGAAPELYQQNLDLDKILTDKNIPIEGFYKVALELALKDKNEEAISYCDKILNLKGDLPKELKIDLLMAKAFALSNDNKYEDAIVCTKLALECAPVELRFVKSQTLNGIFCKRMERWEEAIEHFELALETARNLHTQNIIQSICTHLSESCLNLGKSLNEKRLYERAFEIHLKGLNYSKENKDSSGEASHLEQVGLNLIQLGRHEDAIQYLENALILEQENNNSEALAFCLALLGANSKELRRYKEAIHYYEKVLILIQEANIVKQAFILGQICVNNYLNGQPESAWQRMLSTQLPKEIIFKWWGNIIISIEQHKGSPAAFQAANQILHQLAEYRESFDIPAYLSSLFAGLLAMDISASLLSDIATECQLIFPDFASKTIATAALSSVGYLEALKNGAGELYLENLHPDMAIAVKAMAADVE